MSIVYDPTIEAKVVLCPKCEANMEDLEFEIAGDGLWEWKCNKCGYSWTMTEEEMKELR